jgi:protein-disulfide isomerase
MAEFDESSWPRRAAISGLSVAALTLLIGAAPARPAAPRLSAHVTTSAIGAFVVGKADAKIRLVEYFSYTCGHCGDFARLSNVPLKTQYIDRGLVVFEYRNLVRDPVDMTAALLARCGGATAFAGNHQAIFAAQPTWLTKVSKMSRDQMLPWYEGSESQRARRIAADTGLSALMRARGFTAAQIDACLDSEVAMAEITGMTNIARNADRVDATPTFFINGRNAGVSEWPALKTRLDLAIKGS